MPKVSVYLPDDLYEAARKHDLPISALAQGAIRDALAKNRNAEWIERMRKRPVILRRDIDISKLMDEVRDEVGR
jgi:hypothetical protein